TSGAFTRSVDLAGAGDVVGSVVLLIVYSTFFDRQGSLGARRTHSGGSVSQGGHADAHDHLLLPRENKGTKVSCLGRAQQPPRHAVITASNEGGRSEEHTSEFQSRENLVCRLLLEKKK